MIFRVLVYNIYEMVTPKKIIMKDLELSDKEIARLRKEIDKLKEKLMLTENDRDEWEVKAKDLLKENKELKEELQHYENTRAIQKSNAATIWNSWWIGYVDRELNVIK